MRKIDLTPYAIDVAGADGEPAQDLYEPGKVARMILLGRQAQLGADDLLKNADLADKIKASGAIALLEEEEYRHLLKALDAVRGFTLNDVEFVRRVKHAEKVEAAEKKPPIEVVK